MPRKRTLFLGRDLGFSSVESYAWDSLPACPSLVDYDVVILDFTPGKGKIEASYFPSTSDFTRVLFGGGATQIVAIGNPSREITYTQDGMRANYYARDWLPCFVDFTRTNGSTVLPHGGGFSAFRHHVNQHSFILRPDRVLSTPSTRAHLAHVSTESGTEVELEATLHFANKAQETLGATLVIHVTKAARVLASAKVTWLPAPDAPELTEPWRALLADLGVEVETPPPPWINEHLTPRQKTCVADISSTESQLEELNQKLSQQQAELELESQFQSLLYEDGDKLEKIVCEALRHLGATVELPEDKGKEDARITTPNGARGVVEIKGKQSFIQKDNLLQLVGWLVSVRSEDDGEWKGLLIGNPHRLHDPQQRKPPISGDPCKRAIAQNELCVLTTVELHRQVCKLQEGTFDPTSFWAAVMNTTGVFADDYTLESPGSTSHTEVEPAQ